MNGFADVSAMEMEMVDGGQDVGVQVSQGPISINNQGVVKITSPTPFVQVTVSFDVPKIASNLAKSVGSLVASVTGWGWTNNVKKG